MMKILKILFYLEVLQIASAIFIGVVSHKLKEQCCKEAELTEVELENNIMHDKTLNETNKKCEIYVKCLLQEGDLLHGNNVNFVGMKHYLLLFLTIEQLDQEKKVDPEIITDSALTTCVIYKDEPLKLYNCINLVILKYLPYKPHSD